MSENYHAVVVYYRNGICGMRSAQCARQGVIHEKNEDVQTRHDSKHGCARHHGGGYFLACSSGDDGNTPNTPPVSKDAVADNVIRLTFDSEPSLIDGGTVTIQK
ncbi:MAG: hypothetical protein K2J50_03175, partial [Treponemataceae bacterium]|nr:hypothetical protein [Treponemataceae bacterium]